MSYCRDCVFCREVAERQQQSCGMCDDPVGALKACVAANVCEVCEKKMTREDVISMARNFEELERQRDERKRLLDVVLMIIKASIEGK